MKLVASLLVAMLLAAGCASSPAPASSPTPRQQTDAQKQEWLKDMLEQGQRN